MAAVAVNFAEGIHVVTAERRALCQLHTKPDSSISRLLVNLRELAV